MIFNDILVGGFKHFFHILGIIIPTDFHIFQRGRYTTNQRCICGVPHGSIRGVIFPMLGLGLGFEETPAARRGGRRAAPGDPMWDMIWASKIGIC